MFISDSRADNLKVTFRSSWKNKSIPIDFLERKNIPQTNIAQMVGKSQSQVSKIIHNATRSKTNNDVINPSDIFVYNYWHLGKSKKSELKKSESFNKGFFGKTPNVYMKNLLYYHTEPNDLIVDFFTGSGTAWYFANKMNRRCVCYDKFNADFSAV